MTRRLILATALCTFLRLPAAAEESAPSKWRWFRDCAEPLTTRLFVSLHGRSLFDATLPLCHVPDTSPSSTGKPRILRFFFTADASVFGEEFKHLGIRRIEGNVWEAGGDPDDIILGLSFEAGEQILLNTLHIASCLQPSSLDQATGLVSRTSAFMRATKRGVALSERRRTTRCS